MDQGKLSGKDAASASFHSEDSPSVKLALDGESMSSNALKSYGPTETASLIAYHQSSLVDSVQYIVSKLKTLGVEDLPNHAKRTFQSLQGIGSVDSFLDTQEPDRFRDGACALTASDLMHSFKSRVLTQEQKMNELRAISFMASDAAKHANEWVKLSEEVE